MKKFEVVGVSVTTKLGEDDARYYGVVPGYVAGFNFEVKDKDGNLDYMSAHYMHEDPSEFVDNYWKELAADYFEFIRMNGYEPTGRVVFRGYATEHYDPEERDWYVEPAQEEVDALMKEAE